MSPSTPFAFDDPIATASEILVDSAAHGRLEALRKSLADGGNPNYMRLDISASLAAISGDYLDCLELIVEAGGGGDLPNRMGWTALHEAAVKEDVRFLETLLASDFVQNLSPRDRSGWTPLRAAVSAARLEAVGKILAEDPTQLDNVDLDGVSPVMAAAAKRNVFLVALLLDAGPDLSVKDVNERTLAHYVEGWPEGVELLLDRGIDPAQKMPIPERPVSVKVVQEAEVVEDTAPVNPFGLGGMKKMRKGP